MVAVFTSSPGSRKRAHPTSAPSAQAVGDAGKEAKGCVGLEHRLVRPAPTGIGGKLEEVVHDPQRLEPGGLRRLSDLAQLGAQPRRATGVGERRELKPEAHRVSPRCRSGAVVDERATSTPRTDRSRRRGTR